MNSSRRPRRTGALLGAAMLILAPASPAPAQPEETAPEEPAAEQADDNVIVVRAPSLRGTVIGDIPAETTLDEADVAGYGVGSVEELLEALGPRTGSARGRGEGRPVVLLNGRRVSGFREIRDLPPEAIERVEIFPEELALRYGYRPDQRVVNIILKENFAAITAEAEYGLPSQGGFSEGEIEANLTRIDPAGRLNLDIEYSRSSALTEAERGIVQPADDALGLIDDGEFRALIPESDRLELNASYARQFGEDISATLSGEYSRENSLALLGLPAASFTVPATSPFARIGGDEALLRLFPDAGALTRDTASRSGELGLTLNGQLGGWRWSAAGNYSRSEVTTRTDAAPDYTALAAAIEAGDPAFDPFAPDLASGGPFARDVAHSVSQAADANATIAGSPLALPAGPLTLSLSSDLEWRAIDSRAASDGVITTADPRRTQWTGRANVDIPITSRREGVLDAIGDISLSANAGYSRLSDFGGLVEYGYGLNWEPVEGLSVLASVIGEEAAPTVQQLGDPEIVTPNVSIFDFTRGESVLVERTTGGNPALLAESRRDFKLGVNFAPGDGRDVRFVAEYIRNRSRDTTAAFPLPTTEIEAAFPDRVIRDGAGNLVAIDARPVNFAETRGERIRYGVSLSGRIGADEDERGGGRAGRGEGDPASFLGRRGGRGNRWQFSAYHIWRLEETVLIRPGVPLLDLLDGSVTSGSSPIARHTIELETGFSLDGIGLRASADYTGGARVDGAGSGDLFFGDIATFDLRAFVDFDQRERVIEAVPFLSGGRLSLRVDNLFGGIQRVTDADGLVPLSFQPGFIDPRGRFIELSFRKQF